MHHAPMFSMFDWHNKPPIMELNCLEALHVRYLSYGSRDLLLFWTMMELFDIINHRSYD